jgi:tripartite-type tricarboxylate transporter receptor subunit TctC
MTGLARRRPLLAAAGGAHLAGFTRAPAAVAQEVTRDVRLIVPFAPGGSVDIIGRVLAEALPPVVGGRNVVVENRTGAGGFIGLQAVANAAPDGHILAVGSGTALSVAPVLPGLTMPIHPDRDLTPIANLVQVPMVLVVHPNAPFRTVGEIIARAKAAPGQVTAGTAGPGTSPHLLAARMANEAGIRLEYVPYRGGTPALLDLMAGRIDLYFSLLPESLPHIERGALRPIAAATKTRHPRLPDVPVMAETLPGYSGSSWYGLVGPAGLPPAWVGFWEQRISQVMTRPEVRARFTQFGLRPGRGQDDRAVPRRDRRGTPHLGRRDPGCGNRGQRMTARHLGRHRRAGRTV